MNKIEDLWFIEENIKHLWSRRAGGKGAKVQREVDRGL